MERKWTSYEFFIFQISGTKLQQKDKICPESVFPVKNRKSEHHHWITQIQISLGTKFQFKLTMFFFSTNLPKKVFPFINWKVNITNKFCISELVLVPNFSLNRQFLFFGPNLPKKGISSLKHKKYTIECCIFK